MIMMIIMIIMIMMMMMMIMMMTTTASTWTASFTALDHIVWNLSLSLSLSLVELQFLWCINRNATQKLSWQNWTTATRITSQATSHKYHINIYRIRCQSTYLLILQYTSYISWNVLSKHVSPPIIPTVGALPWPRPWGGPRSLWWLPACLCPPSSGVASAGSRSPGP